MVHKNQFDPQCITFSDANIIYNTRFFWRQLVYWTRAYLNSVFLGVGNAEETYARLYETPASYASMLQLVIGEPVARRYLELFNEYTILLRQLVTAVMNGDLEAINESVSLLDRNSDMRAAFIAETFPSLDEEVVRDMLNTYTHYEFEEINAYVNEDYSRILEIYDAITEQTNYMSEYFARGIIDLITTRGTSLVESGEISKNQDTVPCITMDQLDIILDITLYWLDIIEWSRAYRVSIMANTGNQEEFFARLIQVSTDFGNFLITYLDEETVDVYISQLQEYQMLMAQLLEAQSVNDVEETNRVYQLLIDSIYESAEFLASALPDLDETEWRNHLLQMNTLLINMGTAFLTGNFEANIQMFDSLIDHAEQIGFLFAQSIVDEFDRL